MRHLVQIAILAIAAAMAPAPFDSHRPDLNISTQSHGPVRTCSDLEMTWDGQPAATAVETLTSTGRDLSVHAPRNGGVYILGASGRSNFSISACKGVAKSIGGDGTAALAKIHPSITGNSVSASGPDSEDWVVYFIVDAPEAGNVEVETTNGPVHVERITGSTNARAVNGPIRLLEVSGHATAKAINGPVAYEGHDGVVDLHTENGPIKVSLAGDRWSSGSLTASAQNGPVKVEVPREFHSGVRITSSNFSPWKCEGCASGKREWDDRSRSIELGSGPVAVTVSTVNGPVAVDWNR
jgi:hypothetical protein